MRGGSGLDWTLGCIATENDAIAELFAVLPRGTRVRIE
jgi:L,D-peptidoglycan transpeptidase YkuD (ErfK/YbiS/YcfS/YnhG family)